MVENSQVNYCVIVTTNNDIPFAFYFMDLRL
jgi:hypothetical protein